MTIRLGPDLRQCRPVGGLQPTAWHAAPPLFRGRRRVDARSRKPDWCAHLPEATWSDEVGVEEAWRTFQLVVFGTPLNL